MQQSKGITFLTTLLFAGIFSSAASATSVSVSGGGSSSWTISDTDSTDNGLPAGGTCISDSVGASINDANIPAGSDAYDFASMVWVDNNLLGSNLNQSGQTVTFASQVRSGLTTQVRYRVLTDHAILRNYTSFFNPSDAAITVTVELANNFGSDSGTAIRGTSSGDLSFTTADRWSVTSDASDSDPVNTSVFFGTGSPAVTPTSVTEIVFSCATTHGNGAAFSLTVGPGQTRGLMFFHQMSDTRANALSAATIFDSVSGTSSLLIGLTGNEVEQAANWVLDGSQVAVQVPIPVNNPYALLLLALLLGGIGWVAVRRH